MARAGIIRLMRRWIALDFCKHYASDAAIIVGNGVEDGRRFSFEIGCFDCSSSACERDELYNGVLLWIDC